MRISDADLPTTDVAAVIVAMGLGIEKRGTDASGVCTVSASGRIKVRKDAVPMSEFLKRHTGIGAGAQVVLIHTRLATQGSEKNPLNNHPVTSGNVTGVHNGMIQNDWEVFHDLLPNVKRHGQVDTEAIFAAIDNLGTTVGLESVAGSMAVAWVDQRMPKALWIAKGDWSPLCVIRSKAGSIYFASTPEAVIAGARAAGLDASKKHVEELEDGSMILADEDGSKTVTKAFEPDGGYRFRWSGSNHATTTITKPTRSTSMWDSYNEPYQAALDDWDGALGRATKGADVFVVTDRGTRIYGRVVDVTDGEAWVEWDDRSIPLADLDVLTNGHNVLEMTTGKQIVY